MGLALGMGVILALGGGILAWVFLDEARRLRCFRRTVSAAFCIVLALVCAAAALFGLWLSWSIADAFLL